MQARWCDRQYDARRDCACDGMCQDQDSPLEPASSTIGFSFVSTAVTRSNDLAIKLLVQLGKTSGGHL